MTSFYKPHLFFWFSIPCILLFVILNRNQTIYVNIHDTYFILDMLMLVILISLFFGLIGFGYWATIKAHLKLSIWLNVAHIVLTIGGLLILCVLSLLINEPSVSILAKDLDYNQNFDILMFSTLLISLLGQLVYFVNIIRGAILKYRS